MTLSFDTLLPRPTPVERLYRRCDLLDASAWDVLVRDGHLVPLTEDLARHRSVAPCPAVRAAALAPRIPPGTVVADASAVWVHAPHAGAVLTGPPPARTTVPHRLVMHRGPVCVVYTADRSRPRVGPDVRIRRTILRPDDVDLLVTPAGSVVRVTSTTRTALDVAARHPHEHAVTALLALAAAGADLAGALDRVRLATSWVARQETTAALSAALQVLEEPPARRP